MIHTDNSETLKNALAKIEKLEHENTMLIGEAEELKAKLDIAIEALEYIALDDCVSGQDANKALNKIRSE